MHMTWHVVCAPFVSVRWRLSQKDRSHDMEVGQAAVRPAHSSQDPPGEKIETCTWTIIQLWRPGNRILNVDGSLASWQYPMPCQSITASDFEREVLPPPGSCQQTHERLLADIYCGLLWLGFGGCIATPTNPISHRVCRPFVVF